MPQISRVRGTTSEKLRVFINDGTVTTGAGLANVVASSVTFAWSRDDMSAVSSGTCTTGTLGTYTVSSFVQLSSTVALGWYEFDPPDGIFLSGRKAALHLSGAPSMVQLPVLIELTGLDNQLAMSSQTVSTALNSLGLVGSVNVTSIAGSGPVTTAAGVLSVGAVGVSSFTIGVNVTSLAGSGPVTTSAGVLSVTGSVNMTSVVGTAAVTSSAGIQAYTFDLGRTANPTSTLALSGLSINAVTGTVPGVNISSLVGTAAVTSSAGILAYTFDLGRTANVNSTVAFSSMSISTQSVSIGGVNVTSIAGSAPVTSAAGVLSVTGSVNVSSIVGTAAVTSSAGILAMTFDLGRTANNNSTVAFSSMSISSQSVSVAGVNVTSVMGSAPVTSSAGVLATAWDLSRILNPTSTVALSGMSINVVTTVTAVGDKTGYALTAAEEAAIADALLGRNVSGGSSTGRLVKEAFHAIRNKVDTGAGVVYLTDDVTSSWAFTVSTQAGNPIVTIDPA